MDTINIKVKVLPREIGFLNAIIEAHEGFAVVRTEDRHEGIINIWASPSFVEDVRRILQGLRKYLHHLEVISEGEIDVYR
ncbi:MAG: DUF4911 domain-containing protein [bacterium]